MYWSAEAILAVEKVVMIEEFVSETSLFVWVQSDEEGRGLRYHVPLNL